MCYSFHFPLCCFVVSCLCASVLLLLFQIDAQRISRHWRRRRADSQQLTATWGHIDILCQRGLRSGAVANVRGRRCCCACLSTCAPPVCQASQQGADLIQAGDLQSWSSTARGFEPLRAEPNGFLVHHLSHSVTLSLFVLRSFKNTGL